MQSQQPNGLRQSIRKWILWLTPPGLLVIVRRLRYGPPPAPEWSYRPEGWVDSTAGSGWQNQLVADAQRRKWPRFLELISKPNPLSVSHEAPEPDGQCLASQTALLAFGYCLARCAAGRPELSLLDFGCGAGHYLRLSREFLPETRIAYTGYDLPHLCALGRELNPDATFLESSGDCWLHRYDLVLASGSLQYVRDWRDMLAKLASAARGFLLINRLPSTSGEKTFVVTQKAHAYGYGTEYSGWVFSRSEFLAAAAELGLSLEREFLLMDRPNVEGTPGPVQFRGFLFSKAA